MLNIYFTDRGVQIDAFDPPVSFEFSRSGHQVRDYYDARDEGRLPDRASELALAADMRLTAVLQQLVA